MKTGAEWKAYNKFINLSSYFLQLGALKRSDAFKTLISKFPNGEQLFFKTYWKAFRVMSVNSITTEYAILETDLSTHFDLFMGLLNHSCVPNVTLLRSNKSDFTHYVLTEDVNIGEELFISYQ